MKARAKTAATAAFACFLTTTPVAQAQGTSMIPDMTSLAMLPLVDSSSLRAVAAKLAGQSGKLLARFVLPAYPRGLAPLGFTRGQEPEMHEVRGASEIGRFSLITMTAFSEKIAGTINGYRVGFWPDEREQRRSGAYATPQGFVEVTPANQHTRVSQHFRLADFLTHDQAFVWPKYIVLREELLDKLELVITELERRKVTVNNVKVLSGFRTPFYNLALGDASGRAMESRHQYGDAADIIIDNDNDGRMDDLNRDGRVNFADVRIVLAAVEAVERQYPHLVGGTGLYHTKGRARAFAHIDVRGDKARWVRAPAVKKHKRSVAKSGRQKPAGSKGKARG